MKLNLHEMLAGDLVRLRYVDRYSTCRVNHRETVAEHSFFVGMYAMLIGTWVAHHGTPPKWSLLMTKAMLHDVEENRTGDWPRHFKHSDTELRDNLDRVAKIAMSQTLERLVTGTFTADAGMLICWETAKDETLEGRIVAFADFLSVLSYVAQEHLSGNTSATEHVKHLDEYYESFATPSFDVLRPLILEAGEFLRELFADCKRSIFAGRAT